MNRVSVLSQNEFFEQMTLNQITDNNVAEMNAAFICIHGTQKFPNEVIPVPYFTDHPNVLNVVFDDLADDDPFPFGHCITDEQAKAIAEFIKLNQDKSQFLIHCAAGISRSGAVGTAINTFLRESWHDFKQDNPQVQPNVYVLNLIRKYLNEEENETRI